MKPIILKASLIFFAILFCLPLSAIKPANNGQQVDDNILLITKNMSVEEILNSSNKEIQHKISSKLSFKEKVFLFTHKGKLHKAVKKGMSEEEAKSMMEHSSKEFSLFAFLLGFFLSLIGVLIAYIFMKNSKARSAWIGVLTSLLVGLIVFIRRG